MACDLELDQKFSLSDAHKIDNHKWSWFRRYCHAARVAKSLIHRTSLPESFCLEVRKKLIDANQDVSVSGGGDFWEHEKHDVFKKEHDEQLLIWLNRFVFFFCYYFFY